MVGSKVRPVRDLEREERDENDESERLAQELAEGALDPDEVRERRAWDEGSDDES